MKRLSESAYIGGPGDLLSDRPTNNSWEEETGCVIQKYFIRASDAEHGVEYPKPNLENVVGVRVCYLNVSPAPTNVGDINGYTLFLVSSLLGGNCSGASNVSYFNANSTVGSTNTTGINPLIIGAQVVHNEAPFSNHCVRFGDAGWVMFDKPHRVDRFDWAIQLWNQESTLGGPPAISEVIMEFKCALRV